MINGHGPYAFVVDTGANRSVVSAELAAQLGLSMGPDQAVNGAAGVSDAPTAVVNMAVAHGQRVQTVLSVLPAEAIGGLGMLSLDRLDGQKLTLDFHGRQLRIEGSLAGLGRGDDIVVSARRRAGQLTLIDVELGGVPITAFLDSGAQVTIGNPKLHDLVRARAPKSARNDATILSATGQSLPAEVAEIADLRIGGLRIQHLSVAFTDLHIFRLWDLADRPAILLGVDVLSRFASVALDFAHHEVRFRLPASARG
jgi:predicted aspartyl protease